MDGGQRKTAGADGQDPSPELVRAHLRKLLQVGDFASSPQLSTFLSYIVERKLEGEEDRIKAYSIATEALGRPSSFDPQNDPIVRVQARRLRQALQSYYALPTADRSLRVDLPVGSYVPQFIVPDGGAQDSDPETYNAGKPPAPVRARPWIALGLMTAAVAALLLWQFIPALRTELDSYLWEKPPAEANPLGMPAIVVSTAQERQVPGWFSPELFAKGVETNLSKFDEFVVLAPVENQPLADTDYRLDLVFTGQPSSVLGTIRLVRGRSGEIVWSNRFTVPEDSIDSYELLDAVRKISSTIGQPYGVLYAQVMSDPNRSSDQVCLLSGYEWFQVPERDGIAPIMKCLEDVIARKPGNHVAHMMKAYMHVANFRTHQGMGPEEELAAALIMAKRAVALKPESAGTRQAMMEVQWAREKFDLAEAEGRTAVALNPNSGDVVADFGCRLIYQGKFSEGETYARRAARLNSQPPIWHAFCLFLAAYNTGDMEEAAKVADTLEGHPAPEAAIPVIMMAMRNGQTDKARAALRGLISYDPSIAKDPSQALLKIGLFPEVATPLATLLKDGMAKLEM
jgi:hypothetical protein